MLRMMTVVVEKEFMSCRVSHCEKIVINVQSLGRMSALCSLAYHLQNMVITWLYVNQDRLRLFGYGNTLSNPLNHFM